MNEETCMKCGRKLKRDEIALTKKLINRGATEFMCERCLASYYRVEVSDIRERMDYFRAMGCTLFDPEK